MISSAKFHRKISKRAILFIIAVVLIDLSYFSASYFFDKSIEYPYFVLPFLIVTILFWIPKPMGMLKKLTLIVITFLLTTATGMLMLFLTMMIHDHIMYKVCLPTIDKYYASQEKNRLIQTNDKNVAGEERWWVQHLECEDNYRKGLGPIFSENPPGFSALK